ncbi:MAG: class I SAM-dependent methyltransferase [Gammaproteobacteria bacterium]
MSALYDKIGVNYSALRKPDPRIAQAIERALGDARIILNVGAGTGAYEPPGRQVIAVEPSLEMLRKRHPNAAAAIQACAEELPFDDGHFDASMAILTVHHWTNVQAGLREMRRVTRGRIVIATFDPSHRPWLTDYLPELATLDEKQMPAMSEYERGLGSVKIEPLLVPHDCSDGFLHAYWRRPEAYLDERIRSGSSSFWAIKNVDAGLQSLRHDLESGAWQRRYADLICHDDYDAGYRLVIAQSCVTNRRPAQTD